MRRSDRVLIITYQSDGRPSTIALDDIAAELRTRPEIRIHVWHLVEPSGGHNAADWVVDRLRTNGSIRCMERFVGATFAAHLRGAALRLRLAAIRPSVVLSDDGYGAHLFDTRQVAPGKSSRRTPRWIHRVTARGPAAAAPAVARQPDVVIVPDVGSPAPDSAEHIVLPLAAGPRVASLHAQISPDARRLLLGVGGDEPLILGLGGGDSVAPSRFVRTLWDLEQHHGIAARGVWLTDQPTPSETAGVLEEAVRCGIESRVHVRTGVPPDAWALATAVLTTRPDDVGRLGDHPPPEPGGPPATDRLILGAPSAAVAAATIAALPPTSGAPTLAVDATIPVEVWVDRFLDAAVPR